MSKFDIVVRQANDFVESCYTQEFTEQELKTIEFLITQCKKADYHLVENLQAKHIELTITDFAKMINAHPDQIYREAEKLSENLKSKAIHLKFTDKKGKKAFETMSFVTYMKYADGILSIDINSRVLPYFIEINTHFTEYNLRYIIAMGSSYGIKLYKLLRQYLTIGTREFTIDELRSQFGISEDKYLRYDNFKRNVIEVSKKHINKYTDIQMEYEEIKFSRKVSKLKFNIKSKLTQEKQAKIAFEFWAENNSKNQTLKQQILDARKANKNLYQLTIIKEAFNRWLEKNIYNYDVNSCDPLQYFEVGTLFHNESISPT